MSQTAFIHQDLIADSIKGSNKARYQLYQLYSRAMFNVCFRMMNNREDAEDMLQEALVQAFQKLETFRHESSFGTWLKTIVIHTCINALNKRKLDLKYFDEMHRFDTVEEEPEEALFTTENIIEAMNQLPEGGRIVFSLYLLEGYDHGEISQILNITESTSKTQYMRAKRRVYDLMKQTKSRAI
ncbi:MAG: sigma-70 family RNA polymerase sigma factor [Bacteroidota bacterium]|nr:RNA polymerase subunit sigma-24 [Odoribacter sp.]MDP3644053.1 sigma-70 family RNA polymerase sigma factor [Bacteroidota bacterium]